VALVRTQLSEELSASINRATRIGELEKNLLRLLITTNVVSSSPIPVTPMIEAIYSFKRRFLQEPHSETALNTAFFKVTAVKTSNHTRK
jgi:hypothetical protein